MAFSGDEGGYMLSTLNTGCIAQVPSDTNRHTVTERNTERGRIEDREATSKRCNHLCQIYMRAVERASHGKENKRKRDLLTHSPSRAVHGRVARPQGRPRRRPRPVPGLHLQRRRLTRYVRGSQPVISCLPAGRDRELTCFTYL